MTWLNWPNRISIARIILVVPFVICLLNMNRGGSQWRYATIALFALMALSDALDGYLARRLKEVTPLGGYLDPLGDKMLVNSAMVLLAVDATAVPGFQLPSWVAVLAIGKDILTVLGFLLVYATTGRFFIRARVLGKACTLVQLLMIGVVLVGPDLPGPLRVVPSILWWIASGFAIVALTDYLVVGNRFGARQHAMGTNGHP